MADTCAAFLAVSGCDKALGQVVNAASNFEISIGDTAALIADVMNAEVEINTDEQRLRPEGSEVNRLYGDNSRLRELTGWQPAYGGLEGFRRGFAITAEWFSDPARSATITLEGTPCEFFRVNTDFLLVIQQRWGTSSSYFIFLRDPDLLHFDLGLQKGLLRVFLGVYCGPVG